LDQLSYLFGLEPIGIKFGLENIAAIVASLGHPERAFRTIHVAGTNGKGSVTAMVDAALGAARHRSARYTSPHLIDIRERFVIEGQPVGAEALDRAIAEVRVHIDALRAAGTLDVQPTFFEVTTAIAFELFRRAGVDVAVIEVGLGGRLDATNVVTPEAAAITSIAFDHEQYLGRSLREIAAEKAGIIKPGVPVVVGGVTADAGEAIARIARERGAPLVRAWDGVEAVRLKPDATSAVKRLRLRTPAHDYGDIDLALAGAHQVGNAVVAVRVLEIVGVQPAAIVEGLARVSWPGRLEVRRFSGGREMLLDAAHNPAGAAALASYLEEQAGERPALVFSAMRDKDVDAVLRALLPAVAALVVTRASNSRAADPSTLAERARAIEPALPVVIASSPRAALEAAWRLSPRIVVAGSIFLLGDVMRDLSKSLPLP
jgi:dihydrofolate synthase / folylpolyglutamate synthase